MIICVADQETVIIERDVRAANPFRLHLPQLPEFTVECMSVGEPRAPFFWEGNDNSL
jgi:hypothetical protein